MSAETWLTVQDKKSRNKKIPNNGKRTKRWYNFMDSGAYRTAGCLKKTLKIRPKAVEEKVYHAIYERVNQLVISKQFAEIPDSETESVKAEILRIETEIGVREKAANQGSQGKIH